MYDDKEKWIAATLNSMKDSKKAKPKSLLYSKIEHRLNDLGTTVISIRQWRFTLAAAILLLTLNIWTIQYFIQKNTKNTNNLFIEETSNHYLISNFKIYE